MRHYAAGHADGRVVSSTYIRKIIADGDMEEATRYLGHPHTLSDTVHSGYHIGRKLGTPTINMHFPEGVIIPRHGVYAAKVYLEGRRELRRGDQCRHQADGRGTGTASRSRAICWITAAICTDGRRESSFINSCARRGSFPDLRNCQHRYAAMRRVLKEYF